MTTQQEKTVKLAVLTAGLLALLGMAWGSKADKADVEAMRTTIQRVDERTARIERYLCAGRVGDMGCS